MYYSSWDEPFSTSFAQTARDHDAYVLVQLEPKGVTLNSIAAGGSDAYLRSYADAVAAFGHPVILSFGHEMNGTWYSWGDGHASPSTPAVSPTSFNSAPAVLSWAGGSCLPQVQDAVSKDATLHVRAESPHPHGRSALPPGPAPGPRCWRQPGKAPRASPA